MNRAYHRDAERSSWTTALPAGACSRAGSPAILFERVWPAIWPAVGVAGVFVCAALLDLPRLLPPAAHMGLLGGVALLIVALLVRGLRDIVRTRRCRRRSAARTRLRIGAPPADRVDRSARAS